MRLLISPALTVLVGPCPPDLVEVLDQALSFRDPDAFHDPRFRAHVWDGRIRLMGRVRNPAGQAGLGFPTGLLDRAVEALAGAGAHPEQVRVGRPTPTFWAPSASRLRDLVLRPDQVQALEVALWRSRGLFALATNFGKTAWLAAVTQHYAPARTLVLSPGRDTHLNLVREFARFGVEAAEWTQGRHRLGLVTIATAAAFSQALGKAELRAWLPEVDVLLVDEVHTVTRATWFPIFAACPAPIRLGVSGTIRESKKKLILEAHFGPILHEVREREMSDAGRSATPCILMPRVGGVVTSAFGYGAAPRHREADDTVAHLTAGTYESGIIANPLREQVLVDALRWAQARKLRALVLFFSRQHGERLAGAFKSAGLGPVGFVHGDHQAAVREDAKTSFTAGDLPILLASGIFATGVNLPSIQVLVNAGGWKAEGITAQKLGRALRLKPFEGLRDRVIVLDPYDMAVDLIERHSKSRKAAYEKRGYEVQVGALADLLAIAERYLDAPANPKLLRPE